MKRILIKEGDFYPMSFYHGQKIIIGDVELIVKLPLRLRIVRKYNTIKRLRREKKIMATWK